MTARKYHAFGDLQFEVKRSSRRRTLCLQIRDGQIQVMVPIRTPEWQIRNLVDKHRDWIQGKLREQAARPKATPKLFVDGERFTCLGADYPLRIDEGAPLPTELQAGEIVVTLPNRLMGDLVGDDRRREIEGRLHEWYRLLALETFRDRVAHFAGQLSVTAKSVKVRTYKRRWGSCSAKGELSFNWRLIMAPGDVVDYVAAHEVAHLVHHNHSSEFWAVVARLLPGYRVQQTWLHKNDGLLDI